MKILSLEFPEGADGENDPDEDTADDSADPHKALAQIRFDEFIQQENALKSINELSLKEKPTKSSRKSKESSKDENGLKAKKKKKTKDRERDGKEHKKSKKSRKEKATDNEKENATGMIVDCSQASISN